MTQKRISNSFKLLVPNNSHRKANEKKLNNILPKINLSNSSIYDNNNNLNNNNNDSKKNNLVFKK